MLYFMLEYYVNEVDDYGLSQGVKKGLELAVKWHIEDIMKK